MMKAYNLLFILSLYFFMHQNSCGSSIHWEEPLKTNDLSNFTQVNGTAEYILTDGVLVGTSKLGTPNSFLALNKEYGDFILEFDVKIDLDLNSGVQIRSTCDPGIKEGRVHGYQVEIETTERKWAGGIYEESGRGWLYPLSNNIEGMKAWQNEKWNHYRIEAIGDTIKTWINDIPCAYLIDKKSSTGIIAFQVHSISDSNLEGKQVFWKNIKILAQNLENYRNKKEIHIHQTDLTIM